MVCSWRATVLVGTMLVVPWRVCARATVSNASTVPSMKSALSPPCTWRSTNPGVTKQPAASTVDPDHAPSSCSGPSALIRPSPTSIAPPGIVRSGRISVAFTTRKCRITTWVLLGSARFRGVPRVLFHWVPQGSAPNLEPRTPRNRTLWNPAEPGRTLWNPTSAVPSRTRTRRPCRPAFQRTRDRIRPRSSGPTARRRSCFRFARASSRWHRPARRVRPARSTDRTPRTRHH